MAKLLIRKDRTDDTGYPWHYTWTGPDCWAGGHYGSLETQEAALGAALGELREHVEVCLAADPQAAHRSWLARHNA